MTADIPELPDAAEVEQRYGRDAADYVEVRKQTAKDLGDCDLAEHWQQVRDELRSADAR